MSSYISAFSDGAQYRDVIAPTSDDDSSTMTTEASLTEYETDSSDETPSGLTSPDFSDTDDEVWQTELRGVQLSYVKSDGEDEDESDHPKGRSSKIIGTPAAVRLAVIEADSEEKSEVAKAVDNLKNLVTTKGSVASQSQSSNTDVNAVTKSSNKVVEPEKDDDKLFALLSDPNVPRDGGYAELASDAFAVVANVVGGALSMAAGGALFFVGVAIFSKAK